MSPVVASERSIFSKKNHDYNSYSYKEFPCPGEHVYVPTFRGLDARGGRKLRTDTHTHTHTRGTATVTITMKSTKVQTLGRIWRMVY